jgi:hypothetical protein
MIPLLGCCCSACIVHFSIHAPPDATTAHHSPHAYARLPPCTISERNTLLSTPPNELPTTSTFDPSTFDPRPLHSSTTIHHFFLDIFSTPPNELAPYPQHPRSILAPLHSSPQFLFGSFCEELDEFDGSPVLSLSLARVAWSPMISHSLAPLYLHRTMISASVMCCFLAVFCLPRGLLSYRSAVPCLFCPLAPSCSVFRLGSVRCSS